MIALREGADPLPHPVVVFINDTRTREPMTYTDRARLGRYMAKKARQGYAIVWAVRALSKYAPAGVLAVILDARPQDYEPRTPGAQSWRIQDGEIWQRFHTADGSHRYATRPIGIESTIVRMAQPYTLAPQDLAEYVRIWRHYYDRSVCSNHTVAHAQAVAYWMVSQHLAGFYEDDRLELPRPQGVDE